ncbi:MAG TPA: endonuclease/exonuclease/phosphatase family protein, partial [Aggregatilinea sp.]|uniref:endonuclease/exonuclease/phosphatase family protein n=1 Tax=Aggregatilinea sp. TaxID=2806333 RepID=UPI002C62A61D
AALLRARWLALWLAPGAIAFAVWFAPLWIPTPAPDAPGPTFTAATYNVLGFMADPEQTFAVIEAMDADIVALEELRPTLDRKLRDALAERYPYQVSKVIQGFDGYALLSRYPILDSHIELEIDFDAIDLGQPRYLRAVLDIGGQPVVVYVLHPSIPQFKVGETYDETYLMAQIDHVAGLIAAETGPALLLCDCNTTQIARPYAALDAVLDDSFRERGWGMGNTHPAEPFPFLRLDYVWHSAGITALDAHVWPDAGTSDHHPLIARLAVERSE